MLRLTLDTTSVIHGAQGGEYGDQMNELAELGRGGRVGLAITTAFAVDQETAPPDKARLNLEWLSQQPLIETISGPLKLGYSGLGGLEGLGSDEVAAAAKVIHEIVLPDRHAGKVQEDDEKRRRKASDAQHLTAHFKADYDAFVTDDRDMLAPQRRKALLARTGINVMDPTEAVQRVRQQGA